MYMLSLTELCSVGQNILICCEHNWCRYLGHQPHPLPDLKINCPLLDTDFCAAEDTVRYINSGSSTLACQNSRLKSVKHGRHAEMTWAYLYSRASDAADRKANTALVS